MSPCKDCKEKGCGAKHDTCERYRAFRERKELESQERVKTQTANRLMVDGVMRVTKRNRLFKLWRSKHR